MGELKDRAWYEEQSKRAAQREYLISYNPPWPRMARWPWRFRETSSVIDKRLPILDIGCGPGLLAAYLWYAGHRGLYIGVDWSRDCIRRATLGNDIMARSGHHNSLFWELDIAGRTIDDIREQASAMSHPKMTVVFTEVLEHIAEDYDLVNSVPEGWPIVITVPKFDEPDHVRYFKNLGDVAERYGPTMLIHGARVVSHNWVLLWGEKT